MRFGLPAKFKFLEQQFAKNASFKLLDIGAGNQSASQTKKWFPNCEYHGVDRERNYNNEESDFKCMDQFYELDLTELNFDSIPNQYFDAIMMAHVIEHLPNGLEVISKLAEKLKPGGRFYIEYPGLKSTRLPHMKGTLNFFDDKTHVRVYQPIEIMNTLLAQGCETIKWGTRRSKRNLLQMPIKLIHNPIKYGHIKSSIFWDLFGFAEYVLVEKRN